MLHRKVLKDIENWYYSSSNKALLIEGARQVGKTYLIREFLKRHVKSYVEFNLYENNNIKEAIENAKSTKELLLLFSSFSPTKLVKNETVIFIDEVQYAKEIVTKIKFLIEDGSYKFILSGSILGVELKNINSLPVGYIDILEMYPLDFEEFILANGVSQEIIDYLSTCFTKRIEVDDLIHQQMINLFNLYVIIGGLPEAVSNYIETNNLQKVYNVHKSIDKTYRLDISKYDENNRLLIKDIYDLIPSELNNQNKRFILKNLNEKARFYQYEESFIWLLDSNVGLFTYNVDNPIYPLLASKERKLFKLFLCDTGLLSYKLFDTNSYNILVNKNNINFGALYESVVAQELKAHNFSLFYYNNKKNGEVDFIIEQNNNIIPIEVKSGKDYKRHVALDNLLSNSDYSINFAYTLSNFNVKVIDKRIYLPIYMIMFIKNEAIIKNAIYKVDISHLK